VRARSGRCAAPVSSVTNTMPDNVILMYGGGIRLFDLSVARAPLLPAAHSHLDSNSAGKDHSQHARRPAMILAAQHACRIGVNRYRNELLLPCPRCPRQRPNSRQEARAPHMLRCEGPHRLTQKRPPTLVSVLQSLSAAALTFDLAMSRPIVVTVCMDSSSESREPQQRPHSWHSSARGGRGRDGLGK
jgi:hypothetical protein